MRTLVISFCSVAFAAALVAVAGAAEPTSGVLSVQDGKGVVVLELRDSVVLGVLGSGSIVVLDRTPRDRYVAYVTGRTLAQQHIGSVRTLYRGQGLRFRMLGGGYRITIRGTGIAVSAVGRGLVSLDGDRRSPDDDAGVYSVDGPDCGVEPTDCTPLPDEPVRLRLGTPSESGSDRVPSDVP